MSDLTSSFRTKQHRPTHHRRAPSGSHDDPDSILARLPIGTHDYIRVLGAIIKKKNHEHAKKHKGVSHKTIYERERFLVRFFRELRRETKYNNLDPRQLANRHIEVMVERWVARGLHTATIHNYLSFLRTYASWISKAGMVREPEFYVGSESPHAHRTQVAAEDKSWSAKNVDVEKKIREITAFDVHVGRQLELCIRFALRPKEARHFRPHGTIIPREQTMPRDAAPFPECQEFVRIRHGTKGGRPRDVPLQTAEQRELLARLAAEVAPGTFVGQPGHTNLQSQSRFYYVIRKFGISKKDLGVVAHGLRHQNVNDGYEGECGAASPVRGGTSRPAGDHLARQRAAIRLGHSRVRVTVNYLGRQIRGAECQGPRADDNDAADVDNDAAEVTT
jgi:integrase